MARARLERGYGALLASCGGAPDAGGSQAPSASTQPVKLTFGSKFGAGERAEWAKLTVAKFNETNGPKITVEHALLGDSVQAPDLLIMLASGTGPDVTQTSGSWFSDFADKGALGDVTSFAKRDKLDLSKWYAQEDVFIYKGKQYGMPFWQSPGAYFYNVSLFKRYSVAPSTENWTWDDMLDAAKEARPSPARRGASRRDLPGRRAGCTSSALPVATTSAQTSRRRSATRR